ncbi:MAG: hypothetical protein H0V02_09410 [Nocardioidaceae bacterium]|nr:hypothetical protein [Nocardioidaceae bacterium]
MVPVRQGVSLDPVVVAVGARARVAVTPASILRPALRLRATEIVLAHNHFAAGTSGPGQHWLVGLPPSRRRTDAVPQQPHGQAGHAAVAEGRLTNEPGSGCGRPVRPSAVRRRVGRPRPAPRSFETRCPGRRQASRASV